MNFKTNNKMILHNQLARRRKKVEKEMPNKETKELTEKVAQIFAGLRKSSEFIPNVVYGDSNNMRKLYSIFGSTTKDKDKDKETEKEAFDINTLKPAMKTIGSKLMDYGVPIGVGAATGLGARSHGFGPFESTMLGLAGGAIADPKAYISAFKNRNIDPSLGGPVSGFFANMKKPLTTKAVLAGIGLAPGAAKSMTGILHNAEQTTKSVAEGTRGFDQTGQELQNSLKDTSKNLSAATGSLKDFNSSIAPAGKAIAEIPDIMRDSNNNVKKLFGVLAGAVGVTGAYLVINRLAKLKERVEKERTKQTLPQSTKRKKITIDPGDYAVDFSNLLTPAKK